MLLYSIFKLCGCKSQRWTLDDLNILTSLFCYPMHTENLMVMSLEANQLHKTKMQQNA